MDSGINMPTDNVSSDGFDGNDGPFPSSPPGFSQSITVSFDQGFMADRVNITERGVPVPAEPAAVAAVIFPEPDSTSRSRDIGFGRPFRSMDWQVPIVLRPKV